MPIPMFHLRLMSPILEHPKERTDASLTAPQRFCDLAIYVRICTMRTGEC